MRIVCPHCGTDYHADFLKVSKRGLQDKHVLKCFCGKFIKITFEEEKKVPGKTWWERWKNRKTPDVQVVARVTPTEL